VRRLLVVLPVLKPWSSVRVRLSAASPLICGSSAARACTAPSLSYRRVDSAAESCGSPLRAIS